MLFFETQRKQDLFLSIKSKLFYLTLANLVDSFTALNNLNLILLSKDVNFINGCNAINDFVAKLELGIVEFKKKIELPFLY